MYFITNSNENTDKKILNQKKIQKKKLIIGLSVGLISILSLGIYFIYFNEHKLIRELRYQDYKKARLSRNFYCNGSVLCNMTKHNEISEEQDKLMNKLHNLLTEKCNTLKDLTIITKMLNKINDSLNKYNKNTHEGNISERTKILEDLQKEINNSPRNSKNIIDKIYELLKCDKNILYNFKDSYYSLNHINVYYKLFDNILSA